MSYTRTKSVNFGAARSGLAGTAGYTLTGGARVTAGVAETVAGSGCYAAAVTFADGFAGTITWDTGGSPVAYAVEEINPGADENTDAKVSSRLATSGYTAPDNADVITALADVVAVQTSVGSGLGAAVAAVKAKTDALPASPAAVGSAMTLAAAAVTTASVADGAITSAKFTVAPLTGPATGLLEQLRQVWRRFFAPGEKDATAGKIYGFADDGTTVLTEQNFTDDGAGHETLGAAS